MDKERKPTYDRPRAPDLRWGVEQRLEFIEFRLFWEGGINRSDITRKFGVSVPQASKDLNLYLELAPGNMRYDRSAKLYRAAESMKPLFLDPDADKFLSQLHSVEDKSARLTQTNLSRVPSFDILALPKRVIEPSILRVVLAAMHGPRSLEIRYQSMSSRRPGPAWRWISPHALGFDGTRWHVRAFCHIDKRFKDFLLSRILSTRADDAALSSQELDETWQSQVDVVLVPNPGLSHDQQRVIARDYGMRNGRLHIRVRLALLTYFLRQWGFSLDCGMKSPSEEHVVLADPDAVRQALARSDGMRQQS